MLPVRGVVTLNWVVVAAGVAVVERRVAPLVVVEAVGAHGLAAFAADGVAFPYGEGVGRDAADLVAYVAEVRDLQTGCGGALEVERGVAFLHFILELQVIILQYYST